jgi:hypothetical protein
MSREWIVEREPALRRLLRLVHVHGRRRRLGRDRLEVLADFSQALSGLHVANDGNDGVVGSVIGFEKRRDILD